jgi:predicted nucleotidyltransferase
MLPALRRVLAAESDVAYAPLFGSSSKGTARQDSDVDVAVELTAGAARDVRTLGGLAARLESAAGRPVDLVLLDEAPSPLAYRVFRDGLLLVERDHAALVARKARSGVPTECCAPPPFVVDSALLAAKIAAVRDATARVRAVFCATLAARAHDQA